MSLPQTSVIGSTKYEATDLPSALSHFWPGDAWVNRPSHATDNQGFSSKTSEGREKLTATS